MKIRRTGLLTCCSLFLALTVPVAASIDNSSFADSSETSRLAGLGRLWGTVKFFHPYIASRPIDWDKALVETLPMVYSAGSADDYKRAVDHLLSFLNDPLTKIVGRNDTAAAGESASASSELSAGVLSLSKPQEGVAVIKIDDFLLFAVPEKIMELKKMTAEAAQANTIIIDIRRKTISPDPDNDISLYYFKQAFMQNVPALFQGECPLPSFRHRVHNGYAPQPDPTGSIYSSGIQYEQALSVVGRNSKSPRIIFLIDNRPNGINTELSGLQSSGRAFIIQEGEGLLETGVKLSHMTLPDGIDVQIRMTEIVNADGSLGFRPALSVASRTTASDPAMTAAMDIASGKQMPIMAGVPILSPNPVLSKERAYPEMIYPDREYRLLALSRFWNVIQYFFPYKSIMDIPWDQAIEDFIPRFEGAKDADDYQIVVEELVARLNDSHGFAFNQVYYSHLGMSFPPIEVRWIENQTVVVNVFPDKNGSLPQICVGDVILAVDGEDIATRRELFGRRMCASTPQALALSVDANILRGARNSEAKIKFRDVRGNVREISIPRTAGFIMSGRETPVFRILPEGFGYMDLARLRPSDVDKAFEAIRGTPGIIMDMRGYPQNTIYSIAPRLAKEKTVVTQAIGEQIHASSPVPCRHRYVIEETTEPGGPWRYDGKIVVLINEYAGSAAEHACLFLEAAANAVFVGGPTNGTNGNKTNTVLPGNIVVSFTGIEVCHGDGRQLQRIGIQPNILVRPTIAGVRAGRDEVLERAVAYLKNNE